MSPISQSCRTDLLTLGVTGAAFKIAGEMRRLPAYFDNPVLIHMYVLVFHLLVDCSIA